MARTLARIFLWLIVVFAWLLVVVFGAAVAFGGDLFTRVVGLVIALISLGIALAAHGALRRFGLMRPPRAKPAVEVEAIHPPEDLSGGFSLHGVGWPWKNKIMLRLDTTGFEARGYRKMKRFAWDDVEAFLPVDFKTAPNPSVSPNIHTVGFRLRGHGKRLDERIGRWFGNADRILPLLPMPPAETIEMMERYRQRYSTPGIQLNSTRT
jgi:hypothetical protein